jgi:hypothetical protein
MDGSVSTLAPVFTTHGNWPTLLIGLAAEIGAWIHARSATGLKDLVKTS